MDIITLALAKKSSKSYVDNKLDAITTNMDYKGSVASQSALPSGASTGDVYTTSDTGERYVWNGTAWQKISEPIDVQTERAMAEVQAKGTEVLDSIPSDYTELSGEVADLKSALSDNTRNISTQTVGRYSANSSGVISRNDSNGNIFGMSGKVPCEASTQYTVRYYTANNQNGTIYAAYYDTNESYLSTDTLGSNTKAVFTTPSTAAYVFTWQYRSGGLSINDASSIQLEKGYISTEYIPPIVAYDAVARQGETLNIPYTEHPGYFSTTGSISNPSESNEFYTDKIELSLFRTIGVGLSYGESRALWLVCCTYTADKSFIERITIQSATTKAYGQILTLNDNVKYVAFAYRKFTDGVMTIFGSVSESGMLESVRNLSGGFREQTYLGDFPFRFMACYDHLFVNNSMPSITIPHESLYHVRFSRLFGFNAIEANVKKTATDGVYIVNHLESDKFGKYFHHVDGTTNISDMKPSDKTWDWIVQNVRYNSSIAKYQTRPCRLEEFLSECRQQNIIPFIYTLDDNVISIANEYMGDSNYIAYGASREKCPNAIIYHWVSKPTKAEILAYCESVGRPFIYGMSNPTSFTDSELKDIVDTLHDNGYWVGVSYADQLWYKYSYLGFDVNGTQKYVNRLRNGNICNLNTMYGFGDFSATNATEANGVLTFSADGYIEPNISDTAVNVGMIDLQVDFVGTITVYGMGEQRLDLTYTSDGAYPFFEATPIFNESPKFRIKATSGTVIKDISFIASKL